MRLPYFLLLALFCLPLSTQAKSNQVAIATAHPLATDAAYQTLKLGGNAFDAAITASAVLAVVEPYSSGLGGGGFWLLHRAKDQQQIMIDGRETAPLAAHRDMYLDKEGNVNKGLSINGALAAGIPGEPAALTYLADNYGNLPLAVSLSPAIHYAKHGFIVDPFYQKMAGFRLSTIQQSSSASQIFLRDNRIPELGTLIKQADLAKTLNLIANYGNAGFYEGDVAKKLVNGVQKAGGIWTLADLKAYKIKLRKPIVSQYKDMTITSAALPSSGGIVLSEIFNMLGQYDLSALKSKTDSIHILTEIMRRAYRDRAEYMGDSDVVDVPIQKLTNLLHAASLIQSININKATASYELPPTWNDQHQGTDTTHFSIMDSDGNRVAATLSINYPFGSGFVPEGTGILLNDEMDDFAAKPGVPNVYGLVGAKANEIQPGKRMLSSMSPTFLETKDRIAIIGTPGGSRIISMVALGALFFYHNQDAEYIVKEPRFHHQYLPDEIQFEPNAFSTVLQGELRKKGHHLKAKDQSWGNMQIVIYDKSKDQLSAASDPRGLGKAIVKEK
ncbi:MAG: gamma-glutamyltransferase [Thiotrichaceae bacterium]|nr:gamma-glutamyltransferase [Thiotrichaceae bacterium]